MRRTSRGRIDFGPLPPGLSRREMAEEEARRDLLKSEGQLLADIHDELLDPNRPLAENVAHAHKRIASLMARSSASNARAACVMSWLTGVIAALTLILAVLTAIMLNRM